MRKQYHFRPSQNGYYAWDVDRLLEYAAELPEEQVPLTYIREIDEAYWQGDQGTAPTCREIAEHAGLMIEADLNFPIILSADGRVMDGMHRVCKALIEGHTTILAKRLITDPAPDYVDVHPEDLPY